MCRFLRCGRPVSKLLIIQPDGIYFESEPTLNVGPFFTYHKALCAGCKKKDLKW